MICIICHRKHSSGDLHSRLKTRKLLGVGETDDGDVHRSKLSQILGHSEQLYIRLPRGLRIWQLVTAIIFTLLASWALLFPVSLYRHLVGEDASSVVVLPLRLYGAAMLIDDKVGKDTRDARESSPQPGRKLRGGKVTGRRETGRKETGRKGTGGKTTGVKKRGVAETGGKEKGVGETGGKTTGVKERGVGETGGKEKGVGEMGGKTTGVKERGVGETRAKEWELGRQEGRRQEGRGQDRM
ncbi:Tumor protein p53-inducible protein 11 [Lamellibrachia satsuma]|nr:Tumor protein p53-inducible protein 11 [Lamellibrachia satsuma]